MAIRLLPSPNTTPFPTPMALPSPRATTTSILWCSARARAASTASRGTCGSTSVNSAASRLPSEARTRAAWLDPFRLGVQTKRTCGPRVSGSEPTRSIAPRPKRTRGALRVQPLLGERAALHHFERVGFDLQKFPIRALEIQRVLHTIRAEILDAALVQLAADAIELLARDRNRDMVHAADRFPCGRHRILGKIEEGEQVTVPEVVKPVGRAGQVAVLEELDQRETEHLAVELDRPLDVRGNERQVVNAPGAGRRTLLLRLEIGLRQRLALGGVVNLGSSHRRSRPRF